MKTKSIGQIGMECAVKKLIALGHPRDNRKNGDRWKKIDPHYQQAHQAECLGAIDHFISRVNKRAEKKMLTTGRLEGSHHAAMKEIREELGK